MGARVPLYPRAGASIFDEDGVLIPAGGGIYDVTLPFYDNLCLRGDLLRNDPLNGVGGTLVPSSPLSAVPAISPGRFGAVGDGVVDDTTALQLALTAAAASGGYVFLSPGNYRTTAALNVPSGVCLEFASGAVLRPATDAGLRLTNCSYNRLTNVVIVCPVNGKGIDNVVSGGVSVSVLFDAPRIQMPATGTNVGIDFRGGTGQQIHYMHTILNPDFTPVSSINIGNTGIKFRGLNPTDTVCGVGMRIVDGHIYGIGKGIDLDNCDTAEIRGTRIDTCIDNLGTPGERRSAGSGRGVVLGAFTNQCKIIHPRFENCDQYVQTTASGGSMTRLLVFDSNNEFEAGSLGITPGSNASNPHLLLNATGMVSRWAYETRYDRRAIFASTLEHAYLENSAVANGINYAICDQSGVVSPTIRISAPTGAFSIASIKLQTTTDTSNPVRGAQVIVHNRTTQTMTIRDESTLTAPELTATTAAERIRTRTGANVAVAGEALSRFHYDYDPVTPANSRWVYMGSS